MVVSKTGVVLVVFAFFIITSTLIGLYTQDTYREVETTGQVDVNKATLNFFPAVIKGYKDLPQELNYIIFGVLGITLLWVVVSSLPTFSGGS